MTDLPPEADPDVPGPPPEEPGEPAPLAQTRDVEQQGLPREEAETASSKDSALEIHAVTPEADVPEASTPEELERVVAGHIPDPDAPERKILEASPSSKCLNCGAELPGDYCPACGQKDQPLRLPLHRYMVEAAAEYMGLDARVWPTLRALMVRPGRLTQAYVLGRRREYVRPLRIYITSSLIFFFLLALIDPLGKLRETVGSEYAQDSTMTAAAYLDVLDEEVRADAAADSVRARQLDSLSTMASAPGVRAIDSLLASGVDDIDSVMSATFGEDSTRLSVQEREELREDLEDTRSSIQRDSLDVEDRRVEWQYAYASALPPDSTIRPTDLQQAAELIVQDTEFVAFGGAGLGFTSGAFDRIQDARTTSDRIDAGWDFGRLAIRRLPTVVFLLLPIFALIMKLLYVRRGWYYSEHLIFALHVHAFAFVVFSAIALLYWASGDAVWSSIVGSFVQLTIPCYFLVAMKRVYAQGWIKTLVKAWFIAWLYGFTLVSGAVLAVLLAAMLG